jgi:hypothetical protein
MENEFGTGLYFFIEDKKKKRMLQSTIPIKEPFSMYKNEDGFLHLIITKQNPY